MFTRISWTPDADFIVIEVTHKIDASVEEIEEAAKAKLASSSFADWTIYKTSSIALTETDFYAEHA